MWVHRSWHCSPVVWLAYYSWSLHRWYEQHQHMLKLWIYWEIFVVVQEGRAFHININWLCCQIHGYLEGFTLASCMVQCINKHFNRSRTFCYAHFFISIATRYLVRNSTMTFIFKLIIYVGMYTNHVCACTTALYVPPGNRSFRTITADTLIHFSIKPAVVHIICWAACAMGAFSNGRISL